MPKYLKYLAIVIICCLSTLWFGTTQSYAYFWEMSPFEKAAFSALTSRNHAALKQALINLAQYEPTSDLIYFYGSSFYLYDQEFTDRILKNLTRYLKTHPQDVWVNCMVGSILLDNAIPLTDEIAVAQRRLWHSIPPEQSLSTTLHREEALAGIAHLERALTYITGTTEMDIVEANIIITHLVEGYIDLGEYDRGILTINLAFIQFPIDNKMQLLNYQAECYTKKKEYHQAYWLLRQVLTCKTDIPWPIKYRWAGNTYNDLGLVCLELGKVGEARYWMLQLAALRSPQVSPTSLAKGLMERGYYEEVRKYYKSLNNSPAPVYRPAIQWLYTQLHQHEVIKNRCPIAGDNRIVNWFYLKLRKFIPDTYINKNNLYF
ncbi:MAG: tetratricopeptide repeat protein [bacterium]